MRYPCSRLKYCRDVGACRQKNVAKAFRQLGFKVISRHVNANGTDVLAIDDEGNVVKAEVLNEDVASYIGEKRAFSIRKNLRSCKYKLLIGSYIRMDLKAKRILKNIPKLRLGFQTLPKKFHRWYERQGKVFKRKIDRKRTFKQVKNRIRGFILARKSSLLMYMSNVVGSVCCSSGCLVRGLVSRGGIFVRCLDEFTGVVECVGDVAVPVALNDACMHVVSVVQGGDLIG